MNPGVRYGHRFSDPPSLQKDIFIISAKIYKTVSQYIKDPEYIRYKAVIDRLNVINGYMNEIVTYMLELDEYEKQLMEFENIKNNHNNDTKILEHQIPEDKLEIVLKDEFFDENN